MAFTINPFSGLPDFFKTAKEQIEAVITGKTSDGSSYILTCLNSLKETVFFVDSRGFRKTEYIDEYPSGIWAVPAGASAPDDVTITINGIGYRAKAFDGNTTIEIMSNTYEINHHIDIDSINNGSLKLEWHTHSAPSTTGSGTAKWWFDWAYFPPAATGNPLIAPISMTSLSCKAVYDANKQYAECLAGVELPVPAGGYAMGGMVFFNVRRDPTDDEDNYAADALLYQAALHVPTNSRGSRQRYVK
jgi:hypothetical protein